MTYFKMAPWKRHDASLFKKALGSKVQYVKTTFYEIMEATCMSLIWEAISKFQEGPRKI